LGGFWVLGLGTLNPKPGAQAPKMVTNSFGNRNFMQPMRRLNMHSKYLDLFFYKILGGAHAGGGGLFSFFFLCSLQVLNGFPSGSQCVPQWVFPIAPRFSPICFAQSLTRWAKGGKALQLSIESSILGEPP
jgi:hypothetical protein